VHSGGHCGAIGHNVGNNHAVTSRKIHGRGEHGRNRLHANSNLRPMNVAKFPNLLIGDIDHATGNGKPDSFVSTGLRQYKSVDADYFAIDVD